MLLDFFLVLVLFLIISLIIHHRIKHHYDTDKNETEKWFQYNDINNHETWILVLITILLSLIFFKIFLK